MNNIDTTFNIYLNADKPNQIARTKLWLIALGLVKMEDLNASDYLMQLAREHIEESISIDIIKKRLNSYYKKLVHTDAIISSEKCDKICTNIVAILSNISFSLYSSEYINVHKELFYGVDENAGQLRKENISKSEYIVNDNTLIYSSAAILKEALNYEFEAEKKFSYKGLCSLEIITHLGHFISALWQHAFFNKGNTITIAIFLIKYLHKLGFSTIDYTLFVDYSSYFRNALVRANYENLATNIYKNNEFLMRFLSNLICDSNYILDLKSMHIHYNQHAIKTIENTEKSNVTVINVSPPDKTFLKTMHPIIRIIEVNKYITAYGISKALRISESTVNRRISALKEDGKIKRIGSDKKGYWEVVE